MTLESAIEFIAADELVEVTPKAIRMRKRILSFHERRRERGRDEDRRRAVPPEEAGTR
jgi:GTP-binding protein